MSSEQLMCLPPRVLGYALKQKTWVQLLVDHLRKPNKADESTFEKKLQLDQDAKDIISKAVRAHERGKETGEDGRAKGLQDFAPGKGKGLVIMLHGTQFGPGMYLRRHANGKNIGEPGVGKTLTAESVAQLTGKPLLSVGVSDIGIKGDKVEVNLQKIFALAGIWEAVLLL